MRLSVDLQASYSAASEARSQFVWNIADFGRPGAVWV